VFDFNLWTWLFVLINLVILYLFFKRFLFKPVTAYMEKRRKAIEDSINESETRNAEALNLKHEYEAKVKNAQQESQKIVGEAHARAKAEAEMIVNEARGDAERLKQRAQEDIVRDRERMLKELQSEVAGLALSAASKLLQENVDNERNRAIVDKFLREEGAA
jgi:F-type H+-transporting ATPase subunit b